MSQYHERRNSVGGRQRPGTRYRESPRDTVPAGVIFGCNNKTMLECMQRSLFGLPRTQQNLVLRIAPGTTLFLFNFETKNLHGIFEAKSNGGLDLDSSAFKAHCSAGFPAQVWVRLRHDCTPLHESVFKEAIRANYYSSNKFNFELSLDQAKAMSRLFRASDQLVRPLSGTPSPRNNRKTRTVVFPGRTETSGRTDLRAVLVLKHAAERRRCETEGKAEELETGEIAGERRRLSAFERLDEGGQGRSPSRSPGERNVVIRVPDPVPVIRPVSELFGSEYREPREQHDKRSRGSGDSARAPEVRPESRSRGSGQSGDVLRGAKRRLAEKARSLENLKRPKLETSVFERLTLATGEGSGSSERTRVEGSGSSGVLKLGENTDGGERKEREGRLERGGEVGKALRGSGDGNSTDERGVGLAREVGRGKSDVVVGRRVGSSKWERVPVQEAKPGDDSRGKSASGENIYRAERVRGDSLQGKAGPWVNTPRVSIPEVKSPTVDVKTTREYTRKVKTPRVDTPNVITLRVKTPRAERAAAERGTAGVTGDRSRAVSDSKGLPRGDPAATGTRGVAEKRGLEEGEIVLESPREQRHAVRGLLERAGAAFTGPLRKKRKEGDGPVTETRSEVVGATGSRSVAAASPDATRGSSSSSSVRQDSERKVDERPVEATGREGGHVSRESPASPVPGPEEGSVGERTGVPLSDVPDEQAVGVTEHGGCSARGPGLMGGGNVSLREGVRTLDREGEPVETGRRPGRKSPEAVGGDVPNEPEAARGSGGEVVDMRMQIDGFQGGEKEGLHANWGGPVSRNHEGLKSATAALEEAGGGPLVDKYAVVEKRHSEEPSGTVVDGIDGAKMAADAAVKPRAWLQATEVEAGTMLGDDLGGGDLGADFLELDADLDDLQPAPQCMQSKHHA